MFINMTKVVEGVRKEYASRKRRRPLALKSSIDKLVALPRAQYVALLKLVEDLRIETGQKQAIKFK